MELVRLVAWSTVAGRLQFLVQLPSALSLNRGLKPEFARPSSRWRSLITNSFPAVLRPGRRAVERYIDQILAISGRTRLGDGVRADDLPAPVSLFRMSVVLGGAAGMARTLHAGGDAAALTRRLTKGLRRISFYVVPVAIAFNRARNSVAGALLQTGRFQASDSDLVWLTRGLGIGLLATTQARLCVSLFWGCTIPARPRGSRFSGRADRRSSVPRRVPAAGALRLSDGLCAAASPRRRGASGWIEYLLIRSALSRGSERSDSGRKATGSSGRRARGGGLRRSCSGAAPGGASGDRRLATSERTASSIYGIGLRCATRKLLSSWSPRSAALRGELPAVSGRERLPPGAGIERGSSSLPAAASRRPATSRSPLEESSGAFGEDRRDARLARREARWRRRRRRT